MHIIHRTGMRAERRVEKQLIGEIKRVTRKNNLLCRMAETALEYPEGIVREVLYPVVSEQTLRDLVREFKAQGTTYRQQVYTSATACRVLPFPDRGRRSLPAACGDAQTPDGKAADVKS